MARLDDPIRPHPAGRTRRLIAELVAELIAAVEALPEASRHRLDALLEDRRREEHPVPGTQEGREGLRPDALPTGETGRRGTVTTRSVHAAGKRSPAT